MLALLLVREPFMMWVFSKLRPVKSEPIIPTVVPTSTVTVAAVPVPVGPPVTGVPHPMMEGCPPPEPVEDPPDPDADPPEPVEAPPDPVEEPPEPDPVDDPPVPALLPPVLVAAPPVPLPPPTVSALGRTPRVAFDP